MGSLEGAKFKPVPVQTESASLIGILKGKIRVHGDLQATGLCWDVTRDGKTRKSRFVPLAK
jgi:hypothetical protein